MKKIAIIFIIIPLNALLSQIQPKTDSRIPSEEKIFIKENPLLDVPQSDYLERQMAAKRFPRLREEAEKNLRRLSRILQYYGNEVPDSQKKYNEAMDSYKKAMEMYLSGDILSAQKHMLLSRNQSGQLLAEYLQVYKKRTIEISSELTAKLLGAEPWQATAGSFRTAGLENHLKIIQDKIYSAEYLARHQKYTEALDLYRNAKVIAIITLYRLEDNKQQILENYKTDLEDASYRLENLRFESF